MELKVEGLPELANKIKAFNDYASGKRFDKLGNLQSATKADIEHSKEAKDIVKKLNKSKVPSKAEVDYQEGALKLTFSAKTVPSELVNAFKPKGKYYKFINTYDESSGNVEMIFPKIDFSSDAPKKADITDYGETSVQAVSNGGGKGKSGRRSVTNKRGDRVTGGVSARESLELSYDIDKLNESNHTLKDNHICSGCGNPLSKCTCKLEIEEDIINEALNEDILDDEDILFSLRKLKTEASEALYEYEELSDTRECIDILRYLVRDSQDCLDQLENSINEDFSSGSATQPSSVGSHKRFSLDILPEES